jgi:cytochrome c
LPVGPSFAEIAERFASDGGSTYQDLARIIKYGSSPYRSKWRGKVSGLAMPPNDDTISDLDINKLLVGILTLNK